MSSLEQLIAESSNTKLDRKKLGAFYTPDAVSQALTDWAIRDPDDKFFDPSYGGCSFFRAAVETLRRLGSTSPLKQIFGVDIDPSATRFLAKLRDFKGVAGNFRTADFFDLNPSHFSDELFDVVAGNPPYVRHHTLTVEQISKARDVTDVAGYSVSGSASYWVYFVLHALSFLRRGGRLAMVLPTSLLTAKYADPLRSTFSSRFTRVETIFVKERLFGDAQEGTVIVLAEGWEQPNHVRFSLATDVAAIAELCRNGNTSKRSISLYGTTSDWKNAVLPKESSSLLDRLGRRSDIIQLGRVAKIRIGVVTGANDFFILRPSAAKALGIESRHLRQIIKSSSSLRNLTLTRSDLEKLSDKDAPCLLLAIQSGRLSRSVNGYLATRKARIARQTMKCSIRYRWYGIEDSGIPDAFLTYVNGSHPRLVLNSAKVTCTNAIHRLWWKAKLSLIDRKKYALSFISSLTQLSAELNGRSYGGGVLKLEPSEAVRLLIAFPALADAKVDAAFRQVTQLLNQSRPEDARDVVDEIALRKGLGLSSQEIGLIQESHAFLSNLRSRKLDGARRVL